MPRDTDRRERGGLADRNLTEASKLEQRQEGDRLLDTGEITELVLEIEATAPAQQRAEALDELLERRVAKRHVRERDRLRRHSQLAQGG